jgi:hypothetical protein
MAAPSTGSISAKQQKRKEAREEGDRCRKDEAHTSSLKPLAARIRLTDETVAEGGNNSFV